MEGATPATTPDPIVFLDHSLKVGPCRGPELTDRESRLRLFPARLFRRQVALSVQAWRTRFLHSDVRAVSSLGESFSEANSCTASGRGLCTRSPWPRAILSVSSPVGDLRLR